MGLSFATTLTECSSEASSISVLLFFKLATTSIRAGHHTAFNTIIPGLSFGFHRTTGAVVEAFATQGDPAANTVPGGGVWMSGRGLAYDGAGSMFFSTGNGYASELPANGHPLQGRNPPTALEEAVVNMKINSDGTIQPVDFFMH